MKISLTTFILNEATLHLAQLIGPIAVLLGISFLLKAKDYMAWFKHIDRAQPYLFLQGLVEAAVGLAIVLHHNLWGSAPEIIISLLGWGMIFEGSLALLTSNKSIKRMVRNIITPDYFQVSSVFCLILGGYLTWVGYFV